LDQRVLGKETRSTTIGNDQINGVVGDGGEGVGGGGGVIFSLRGNEEIKYAWGLGTPTNNQAKAYTLLQGLNIDSSIGIQSLSAIGDSKNIIKHLVLNTTLGNF
jgi:ribonuclease HI